MASPPFDIAHTTPAVTDLISVFPTAETSFRDIVESWLNLLSTSADGLLKAAAFPATLNMTGKTFQNLALTTGAFNGTVGAVTPSTGAFTGLTLNGATPLLATNVITQSFPFMISVPVNQSYTMVQKASFGGTITEAVSKCLSGTCTATFKINSTNLGGTANAVSSAEQAQAHSSANVFVAGDDIVVTVSANAACLDAALNLKYTRALS